MSTRAAIQRALDRLAGHADDLTLTGTAQVARPSTAAKVHNPNTGRSTRAHTIVYTGPAFAAVTPTQGSVSTAGAGESINTHHRLRFPRTADIQAGDRVTFTANPGDTRLVGTDLFLLSVSTSSLLVQRTATAVQRDQLPAGEWADAWS